MVHIFLHLCAASPKLFMIAHKRVCDQQRTDTTPTVKHFSLHSYPFGYNFVPAYYPYTIILYEMQFLFGLKLVEF